MYLYNINNKKTRKNFSKHNQVINLSNLLDIQINSFKKFIEYNINNDFGIDYIFKSIFPILNYNKNIKLDYISYKLDKPNIGYYECKNRGITYSSSLKVKLKLIIYNKLYKDEIYNEINQEVYMGEIPVMTENASFIINGVEKVVVSQLHRSPGVFFDIIRDKLNSLGKNIYNAKIIPYRGSWLDIEFDTKDHLFARIDKKRKFPVTIFFHALNFSDDKIIETFCEKLLININNFSINIDNIKNKKFDFNINIDDVININKNTYIIDNHINILLKNNISNIFIPKNYIIGKLSAKTYYDNENNIILKCNDIINNEILNNLININCQIIELIYFDNTNYSYYISETLKIDNTYDYKSAIIEIHKIIRPGEFQSLESSEYLFKSLFFSKDKYDLSKVGRIKIIKSINKKFNENIYTLNEFDFIEIIKKLIDIKHGKSEIDDIDNLGNRRVKSVGEMIENQFRLGLLRIEKNIKDRLSIGDIDNITPQKIISTKQISSTIREFFNSSQLSQFMDQNNPLAEITHKRRISALGPGGLTRERAGFEVRDVHPTHYGRLCPIETPEGPNIGLINSLSIYARVNEYGFLETPYQIVKNGIVTKDIQYLSAIEELNFIIAQSNAKIDINNKFVDEYIICRYKGEFNLFNFNLIKYIDVSNQQIVSIGSSLIPFLEHNDANRALMGANMQRQAVPLIKPESPIVGTGMELKIALDSGANISAKRGGEICYIDSNCIIIKVNENEINEFNNNEIDVYKLKKFTKSNQNTCINYFPCVNLYDKINKNDIISDSQSTSFGELSLGKNIKVAFMSWYGYNFEDSMIISERLITDDIFTSIHIQELICTARDTKLGPEEITSDIPNISESYLSKLDESGIINIGSYVSQGDVLVGKITPKGETQLTPEEKLLRAIFGEKASNVKDSSLKVPNGLNGTIIDVQIFTKEGIKKDNRTLKIEDIKLNKIKTDLEYEKKIIKNILLNKIKNILNELNIKFDISYLNKYDFKKLINNNNKITIINNLIEKYNNIDIEFTKKLEIHKKIICKYDELPPGVLKIIKIYLASKKYIQPGDKMAGRHGNKGVVSKVNSIEDMPYDKNGVPIDIILNPLGVPSRMNIGQILEAHLGLAAKEIGKNIENIINQKNKIDKLRKYLNEIYNSDLLLDNNKIDFDKFNDNEIYIFSNNIVSGINISTPVFDGINEKEIKNMLNLSNVSTSGQIELFDGLTGEKFHRSITVGYIYMMKLNHLVDDKMHARSTGSYSLITQQPLGGKAQFGGQRFGEMEVWALEAYGAAYTLQEMLTVKSDDVNGRINMYKNIIHGNHNMEISIPESFNVLFKEIRSLGINIELDEKK